MAWGDDYEKDDEQEADEDDDEALTTHNDHIICKYSMQQHQMLSASTFTAHEQFNSITQHMKSDIAEFAVRVCESCVQS
jgi:hypothetical protein